MYRTGGKRNLQFIKWLPIRHLSCSLRRQSSNRQSRITNYSPLDWTTVHQPVCKRTFGLKVILPYPNQPLKQRSLPVTISHTRPDHLPGHASKWPASRTTTLNPAPANCNHSNYSGLQRLPAACSIREGIVGTIYFPQIYAMWFTVPLFMNIHNSGNGVLIKIGLIAV